jgi:hypothetical protein
MIHGLTFKEYVAEEKEKFSEMTKEEKISYFKEYYLKLCIFAFICLIFLLWFLTDMILSFRHTISTGGVIGAEISEEGTNYLTEDYMKYLDKSKVFNKIDFAPNVYLDKSDSQTVMALQAELATNTYNYLISTETGLDFVADTECLADLNEVLDDEMKNLLADKIVYKKIGESGEEIAAAIDITDTAFTKEYISAGGKVYYIITGKSNDYESGLNVLKYLLQKTS